MPNRRARDYDLSPFFLYHVDSRPVMVSAIYLFMLFQVAGGLSTWLGAR